MLPFWFQTSFTVINRPTFPSVKKKKKSIQIRRQELLLIILLLTLELTQISLSNQTLIDQKPYPVPRLTNNLMATGIQRTCVKQGEDWDPVWLPHPFL